VAALEETLTGWALGRLRHLGWDALTLDGKTARGSADGDVPGAHLLTACVRLAAPAKGLPA
jgi:hypothetical protein